MTTSLINVGGQTVDASNVTVPADRTFRDAWILNGTTIEVDAVKKHEIMSKLVNAERDRRLCGDFLFNGVPFQRDPTSLQRITGAATLAGFAIAQGAQPGNLRWANADRDFAWIASDNTVVTMDAQTTFAFGQIAAGVETSIIFAAKALRDMNQIPTDYADEKYWP